MKLQLNRFAEFSCEETQQINLLEEKVFRKNQNK